MKRYALITLAMLILLIVYLFQKVSYAGMINFILPESLTINHPYGVFIFNRIIRLIINDAACMLLIWSLFGQIKYLKAAFVVFLIELFILLPLYFVIKLNLEGASEISSPLLSQIHRIIVNPLLMLILILGFYYQKVTSSTRA
ncbi:MAG: exosortase F system-associated protein [Cytophagales bacterium]|nr:exosortase F system-associated protein [Cytophagales bacterium]